MADPSWRALVHAHHDFVPHATEALRNRLHGSIDDLDDDPVRWGAVRLALSEELRALGRPPDLATGRAARLLVDWGCLGEGDADDVRAWLHRTRLLLEARRERAERPADRHDPDVDSLTATPAEPADLDPLLRVSALVLVAFNGRDGRSSRRDLAELADRVAGGEPLGVLSRAVLGDPDLAAEWDALTSAARVLSRLAGGQEVVLATAPPPAVYPGFEDWPWVLSHREGGLVRLASAPATWLLRVLLVAFRGQKYPESDARKYARRHLGQDVHGLLRAWGYPVGIQVRLAEKHGRLTGQRITRTIQAALGEDHRGR